MDKLHHQVDMIENDRGPEGFFFSCHFCKIPQRKEVMEERVIPTSNSRVVILATKLRAQQVEVAGHITVAGRKQRTQDMEVIALARDRQGQAVTGAIAERA